VGVSATDPGFVTIGRPAGLEPAAGMADDGGVVTFGGTAMADPAKSVTAPPAEAEPEYTKADSLLFQFWLVLFLLVICFALVNYLMSYLPR
jgi:hypothetical protein